MVAQVHATILIAAWQLEHKKQQGQKRLFELNDNEAAVPVVEVCLDLIRLS